MPLDMFQRDQDTALADATGRMAPALPTTFGDAFSSAWDEARMFGQSNAGVNAREAAANDYMTEIQQRTGVNIAPDINPEMPVLDQINERSKQLGIDPLSEEELQRRAIERSQSARAAYAAILGRDMTFGGKVGAFVGGAAGTATDPINLLAFPLAAPESLGVLGTALAWAAIGGATQTANEVLGSGFREQVQPGYAASGEPMRNVALSAAFAGVLGGGLKGVAAAWTRVRTGDWPRTIRDAGNVVESEAQIANSNPFSGVDGEVAHRTALQQSIEDVVGGRPVNVDNVVTPSILQSYEARLGPVMEARASSLGAEQSAAALEREAARLPPTVERLSEQQLLEARDAGARIAGEIQAATSALDTEVSRLQAGQADLAERQTALTGMRSEVDGLRNDLAAAEQKIAAARGPVDETTRARLSAIETDLQTPGLSAKARTALETERTSINETLAATGPQDARLAASLQQERAGLAKALGTKETALARAEAAATKQEQQIAAKAEKLPRNRQALAERATSRQEAATGEMRRRISALAQDGYGLRLPRTDAQAMAERLMATPPDQMQAALNDITETLVDRAVQLRRAAPEVPGLGRAAPVAEQRTRSAYWLGETRKRIQALAREVGYEMPADEAARIAETIAKLPDEQALAVLDELMLRPRTLADTLPGAGASESTGDVKGRGGAKASPGPTSGQREPFPQMTESLRQDLAPEKIDAARVDPNVDDGTARDLDRLLAEKPDMEIPVGTAEGPDGGQVAVKRSVAAVVNEADERLAAAKEIEACAGGYEGSPA